MGEALSGKALYDAVQQCPNHWPKPSFDQTKAQALTELDRGQKYYRPHKLAIAILILATLVFATFLTLNYLNKISLPNHLKMAFLTTAPLCLVLGILSSWYVIAKLNTLNAQYGWTKELVTTAQGETFDVR